MQGDQTGMGNPPGRPAGTELDGAGYDLDFPDVAAQGGRPSFQGPQDLAGSVPGGNIPVAPTGIPSDLGQLPGIFPAAPDTGPGSAGSGIPPGIAIGPQAGPDFGQFDDPRDSQGHLMALGPAMDPSRFFKLEHWIFFGVLEEVKDVFGAKITLQLQDQGTVENVNLACDALGASNPLSPTRGYLFKRMLLARAVQEVNGVSLRHVDDEEAKRMIRVKERWLFKIQPIVITEMFEKYEELIQEQAILLGELKNSSGNRRPGLDGGSSEMPAGPQTRAGSGTTEEPGA